MIVLTEAEQKQCVRDLTHFVELARSGKSPGASGGAQRAHRIAKILLDDAPGLDQQALVGLGLFARVASANWSNAFDLINRK
jgi:hypothetical protein